MAQAAPVVLPPPPAPAAPAPVERVDRSKFGGHHHIDKYNQRSRALPDTEFQMYTWPDCTLRELTDLLKEVFPSARKSSARIVYAIVYPDRRGTFVMRQIGSVNATRRGDDDIKTLKELAFQAARTFKVSYADVTSSSPRKVSKDK